MKGESKLLDSEMRDLDEGDNKLNSTLLAEKPLHEFEGEMKYTGNSLKKLIDLTDRWNYPKLERI